jgi:hypothetical protein
VTPIFGAIACGDPWPVPIGPAGPTLEYVPATLDSAPVRVMVAVACSGEIAAVSGERVFVTPERGPSFLDDEPPVRVDDPRASAIGMATAIRAASERQGFAATTVFGGSFKELEGMNDKVTAMAEAAGTFRPGIHNVPPAMRDRGLATALRGSVEAFHFTVLERNDLARSVEVVCQAARCTVLVTEALARCDAPEGLVLARLAPESLP